MVSLQFALAMTVLSVCLTVLLASSYIADSQIMFITHNKACTWKEFKEIRNAGYIAMRPYATESCSNEDGVKLTPVVLKGDYALLRVKPDGVNCVTDEAWMVLVKDGKDWKFIFLGTAPPAQLMDYFIEDKEPPRTRV